MTVAGELGWFDLDDHQHGASACVAMTWRRLLSGRCRQGPDGVTGCQVARRWAITSLPGGDSTGAGTLSAVATSPKPGPMREVIANSIARELKSYEVAAFCERYRDGSSVESVAVAVAPDALDPAPSAAGVMQPPVTSSPVACPRASGPDCGRLTRTRLLSRARVTCGGLSAR